MGIAGWMQRLPGVIGPGCWVRVGFEIIENLKLGFLGVESENLSLFFYVIRPWGYSSAHPFCPGLPHIEECGSGQGNHLLK